ncbi:hypothetical protein [Polycladidibacter stylochi]|uniref:hypothetical protein n=1 Tax=Polycladidibacter stylochi TaxID=1807766 RepID=UPI000B143419|nr:hypothetical protein [Pseudovibrio stylochi]
MEVNYTCALQLPERLAQEDERYLIEQCIILDIKIFLATLLGRGVGDRIRR